MQLLIDLLRALRGLDRLLRFDESYRDFFDKTIQGTWRSFFAMTLVAPAVALELPEDLAKDYPNATWFEFFAVEIGLYVIAWAANPLVAIEIGRRLGRGAAMPAYITIYNWFQLINIPFAAALWAAAQGGAAELGSLFALAYFTTYFVYLFFIARSFLQIEPHLAALFVVADLGIFIILATVRRYMLLA
jgi:hypothetical protein